jgi:hypothetical protein
MWWIVPTCLASSIQPAETWSFCSRIIAEPRRLTEEIDQTISICGEGACRIAAPSRWTAQQAHFQGCFAPQREQVPRHRCSVRQGPFFGLSLVWTRTRSPVGAGLPAMVVNDNACELDERGALESIASRLAPTVSAWARSFVGAGLPAMVVNDNAWDLDERGALESIASRLAPTVLRKCLKNLSPLVLPPPLTMGGLDRA